jgi:hypothetical protein
MVAVRKHHRSRTSVQAGVISQPRPGQHWGLRPFDLRFSRTKKFRRIGVGQHHIGITLKGVEIMMREAIAGFRSDEEDAGLFDQSLGDGVGHGLFGLQRFIHGDDELRKRLQPGEPRIGGEELQKMIRRGDRADGRLVAHALGIDEGFVEREERVAKVLQSLADSVSHREGTSPVRAAPSMFNGIKILEGQPGKRTGLRC